MQIAEKPCIALSVAFSAYFKMSFHIKIILVFLEKDQSILPIGTKFLYNSSLFYDTILRHVNKKQISPRCNDGKVQKCPW